MRALARILAVAVMVLLAGLISIFSLLDMLDPIGTKMADDSDPFGPADPWWYGLFGLALSASLLLLAGVVLRPLFIRARSGDTMPQDSENPRSSV